MCFAGVGSDKDEDPMLVVDTTEDTPNSINLVGIDVRITKCEHQRARGRGPSIFDSIRYLRNLSKLLFSQTLSGAGEVRLCVLVCYRRLRGQGHPAPFRAPCGSTRMVRL